VRLAVYEATGMRTFAAETLVDNQLWADFRGVDTHDGHGSLGQVVVTRFVDELIATARGS